MSDRRPARRRRRQRPSPAAPPPEAQPTLGVEPDDRRRRYGIAALILAVLAGTLLERLATVLPSEALNVFHLLVGLAIALLVTRLYRNFMRRTLARQRARRQASRR